MQIIYQLPGCPESLPAFLKNENLQRIEVAPGLGFEGTRKVLAAQTEQAVAIAGGESTPPLVWFAAQRCFPERSLYYAYRDQQGKQQWCDLRTGDDIAAVVPAENDTATLASGAEVSPQGQPRRADDVATSVPAEKKSPALATGKTNTPDRLPRRAESHTHLSASKDGELIYQAFRRAAWGAEYIENRRALDDIISEVATRSRRSGWLVNAINKAIKDGNAAHHIAVQLQKQINRGASDAELESWLKQQLPRDANPPIEKYIRTQWKKYRKFLSRKQKLPKSQKSALKTLVLKPGESHPNNILNLPAADRWDVLIDETGEEFISSTHVSPTGNKKAGKLVALAVSADTALPRLKKSFHSADAPPGEVDKVVQSILGTPGVGVFGFQAESALTNGWFSQVLQLVRWVLLMLPEEKGKPLTVRFHIEQRGDYKPDIDLFAIKRMLEAELEYLAEGKYRAMNLSLNFIDKNGHRYNGYVDSLAYTWGGTMPVNKDRLKATKLSGHCFINTLQDMALEKLYLLLCNPQQELTLMNPEDWYQLCAGSAKEPDSRGLLNEFLSRFGKRVQRSPPLWNRYLEHVKWQLQGKQFHLDEIGSALNWLKDFAPPEKKLSPLLQLNQALATLAINNHQGKFDLPLVQRCLELAISLESEQAQDTCTALLRIAVMGTNMFDFDCMLEPLQKKLAQPVSVYGRKNVGKIHSQLGQLYAFKGQYETADACFNQALATFKQMSDKDDSYSEIQQTRSYQLLNKTDIAGANNTELKQALLQALSSLSKKPADRLIPSIARSGHEHRYSHHLLLRTLFTADSGWDNEISAYLNTRGDWQSGTTHPWALIEAYRAFLLYLNRQQQHAAEALHCAINLCETEGDNANASLFQWITAVLATAGWCLGITGFKPPSVNQRQWLESQFDKAPHNTLESVISDGPAASLCDARQQVVALLQQCLPFNFH